MVVSQAMASAARFISLTLLSIIVFQLAFFQAVYAIDHEEGPLDPYSLRLTRSRFLEGVAPILSKGLVFRDLDYIRELMGSGFSAFRAVPIDRGVRFGNEPAADPPRIFINKRITRDTPGFFPFENEPSIAVNKADPMNLVMASHDFNAPEGGIAVYRSYDGGDTWLGPVFLNPTYGSFTSDPVVASNRSGFFFVLYLSVGFGSDISLAISGDGGATWEVVRALKASPGYYSVLNDKPWMAIGPDPNDPSRDNIYITYTEFVSYGSRYDITINLIKSSDGGLSFSTPINISQTVTFPPYFVQGSTPVVADDGTLYVVFHGYQTVGNETKLGIWVVRSDDGGETFTPPILVAETPVILPFFGGVYGFRWGPVIQPFIETGPNGEVYIVFEADPDGPEGPDMADIFFTRSLDRGETWSEPVRVNDDSGFAMQFFPSMAVDSSGTIHVIWGDKRNDPWGVGYDIYYTYSTDGGASWAPNERVSDITIDPLKGIPFFIGDYFDMDVANGTVHVVWTDSRRGAFTPVPAAFGGSALNQDIFYARLGSRGPPEIEVRSDSLYEGFSPVISIDARNLPVESFVSVAVNGYTIVSNVQTDSEGRLSLTVLVPSMVVDGVSIQIYNPVNGEVIASRSLDLKPNPVLETLNVRVDSLVERVNKLNILYRRLDSKLDQVSNDLSGGIGELREVLERVNATLVGFQNSTGSMLALIRSDIGYIARDLRELNASIIDVLGGVAAIRTSIGVVLSDLSLIKAEISEVRGDIAVVNTLVGDALVRLDRIIRGVEGVRDNIVVLRTDLGDLRGEVLAIRDGVALIETELGAVSIDLARYNESLSMLVERAIAGVEDLRSYSSELENRNTMVLFILINIWGLITVSLLVYVIFRRAS